MAKVTVQQELCKADFEKLAHDCARAFGDQYQVKAPDRTGLGPLLRGQKAFQYWISKRGLKSPVLAFRPNISSPLVIRVLRGETKIVQSVLDSFVREHNHDIVAVETTDLYGQDL